MSDLREEANERFKDRPDNLNPTSLCKLGLLVAGIAHNLYGPLTGILGTLDLLKMKYPDMSQDLDRVSKLGRRLQDDIKVMLFKAQIESRGELASIDLVNLINTQIEFFKADPRLKHMIQIQWDAPANIPAFWGPIGDFSQAIGNIMVNSIEALSECETKELTISLREEAENIILQIADTGVGMDDEAKKRAFEPFFTTKAAEENSRYPATLAMGLGLAHVHNLMEPLGVEITIDSTPGTGTTVSLSIPFKEIDRRSQLA